MLEIAAFLTVGIEAQEPRRPYIAGFAELLDVLTARLHRLDTARDRRAAFCRAYIRYVAGVRALASAGVLGAAADWTERLEVDFARQYLRGLDGWDRRDFSGTPAAWRCVFAQSRHGDLAPHDDLRLHIYAHFAYDLPIALARTGLNPSHRREREEAYRTVTRIAADCLFASEGAPMAADWLDVLRRRAWADAVALYDAEDADQRASVFAAIERDTMLALAPFHVRR